MLCFPSAVLLCWQVEEELEAYKKSGDKYLIQPAGSSLTWLCGLYRFEWEYPVFTILTRESTGELSRLHDRMPLILPEHALDAWIDPATPAETVREISAHPLTEMVLERAIV